MASYYFNLMYIPSTHRINVMPLTLEQYADYLDTRNLTWPDMPVVDAPKAKPHLKKLKNVHCVLWNVYGTLLAISEGELKLEVESKFVMSVAIEKTIHEFKMWGSMSRKPGQPSEYMREIYAKALSEAKM